MLKPLGLALRSASANGCGGVNKAESKSKPIGSMIPIDLGGQASGSECPVG
jgi:hypothetical protein